MTNEKNFTLKELEEKHQKYQDMSDDLRKLNKQESEIYYQFIKELNVVSFLKEKNYYFTHPDYDDASARGPILYKDERNNMLYVYDLEDNFVRIINMYNTDDEHERKSIYGFFSDLNIDFDIPMRGLFSLNKLLDKYIDDLSKSNNKAEKTLGKYTDILNSEYN